MNILLSTSELILFLKGLHKNTVIANKHISELLPKTTGVNSREYILNTASCHATACLLVIIFPCWLQYLSLFNTWKVFVLFFLFCLQNVIFLCTYSIYCWYLQGVIEMMGLSVTVKKRFDSWHGQCAISVRLSYIKCISVLLQLKHTSLWEQQT